jgi:hypothetical protein
VARRCDAGMMLSKGIDDEPGHGIDKRIIDRYGCIRPMDLCKVRGLNQS